MQLAMRKLSDSGFNPRIPSRTILPVVRAGLRCTTRAASKPRSEGREEAGTRVAESNGEPDDTRSVTIVAREDATKKRKSSWAAF
jgi:hypothetical protein